MALLAVSSGPLEITVSSANVSIRAWESWGWSAPLSWDSYAAGSPSVDLATDSHSLEQVFAGSDLVGGVTPPELTSWCPRTCVLRGLPHSSFHDGKLYCWRPGTPVCTLWNVRGPLLPLRPGATAVPGSVSARAAFASGDGSPGPAVGFLPRSSLEALAARARQ